MTGALKARNHADNPLLFTDVVEIVATHFALSALKRRIVL